MSEQWLHKSVEMVPNDPKAVALGMPPFVRAGNGKGSTFRCRDGVRGKSNVKRMRRRRMAVRMRCFCMLRWFCSGGEA